MDLFYGKILCPSVNITNNICYYDPAIYFKPTTGTGSPPSEMCCISYSSIVNNTSTNYNCIYFDNYGSSHRIDTCNILNNDQYSSSYGIIYSYANLLIKDSCILGNNIGKKVFYQDRSSCVMTISNCTIDNSNSFGSITFTKMNEKTFINALSHIATQRCDSYFDSFGTLTVNIPSRIPRCLMSCNCNYNFNYYYTVFSFYKLSLVIKFLQ
jgi:hypothetical protein